MGSCMHAFWMGCALIHPCVRSAYYERKKLVGTDGHAYCTYGMSTITGIHYLRDSGRSVIPSRSKLTLSAYGRSFLEYLTKTDPT